VAAETDERPAPSAFWSGTITFGLVSVPVDLYPALQSRRIRLRLFSADGRPLRRRYVCSADGEALDQDDIARGYEWDEGRFILVDDEELEALAPRKSRDIEVGLFVDWRAVPLAMLEHSYVLAPAGESTKAYHLLAATMEHRERAGIATFVMRGHEHLAAIVSIGGLLRAFTLRFAAGLRTPRDIGLPPPRKVEARDRKAFERAIERLAGSDRLNVNLLDDDFENDLREISERKSAAGADVVHVAPETGDDYPEDDGEAGAEIIDIMSILRSRVGSTQTSGRRAASKPAQGSDRRARSSGTSRSPKRGGSEARRSSESHATGKATGAPERARGE
jgi:DNA end-binding protein Ku